MIPAAAVTEWGRRVDWPAVEQIEQDLLLSRLIVEIANDDYLGTELVFRGGTCLHKLHLPEPLRYSEDLDYVRSTAGGIKDLTQAVSAIGDRLGMKVNVQISQHPKILLRAPFESGTGGTEALSDQSGRASLVSAIGSCLTKCLTSCRTRSGPLDVSSKARGARPSLHIAASGSYHPATVR